MINIMNEYASYTRKCLNNYMKLIFENKFDKYVSDTFASTYIDVRYGNYYNEQTVKLSVNKKIDVALEDTLKKIINENSEYKDIATKTCEFYKKIYNIDQLYLLESQKNTIASITSMRKKLLGLEDDNFESEFNNLLRDDIKKRKVFLDGFVSDTFEVKYNVLDKSKKYYYAKSHNKIKFPELYSDQAIKKVSEKDSIQEDLAMIAYLQTTSRVVFDLISCDFDSQYFIDLPKSLFDKKSKLSRIVNIIDNQYVQDKIKLVVSFECFVRYKSYVLELARNGFVLAIYLDKSFDYSSDNIEYLEVFDKIIMENGKYYNKDMKNNVKINTRIISVDEVK